MAQCEFKLGNWQCPENGYKESMCIFHIPLNSGIKDQKFLFDSFVALINKPTDDPIRFDGAVFPNSSIFSGITCKKAISFNGATFHGGADFTGAKFSGNRTTFDKCQFIGDLIFNSSDFQCKTLTFKQAVFTESIYFKKASINCDDAIDFTRIEAQKNVIFDNAQLKSNNISFTQAIFQNGAISFIGTRFRSKESTSFELAQFGVEGRRFPANPIFQGVEVESVFLEGGVNFKNVKISEGERNIVIFERVNLGQTEFLKTDLSRARFIDVTWNHQRDLFFFGKWRSRLYDEKIWKQNNKFSENIEMRKAYITELSYLCRTLKKYYLETGEIGLSGHFHYGYNEVLLAQETFDHGRGFSFMRFLHKITSGYGEDYFVAFFWLILFIFGSAFVYSVNGVPKHLDSCLYQFAHSLIYSIQVGTLSRIEFYNYRENETGLFLKIVQIFESVLVPTFLAFFVIALRNRFRR